MTILNRVSSQVILAPAAGGASAVASAVAPPGQALFGTNVGSGTFSWTVPANVKTISAVAVGGGGGGPYIWDNGGGGGGGLGWKNNIAVQPGQSITVEVGVGGFYYSFGAAAGGVSYVLSSATVRGGPGQPGRGGAGGDYAGDGGGAGGQPGFFGGSNSGAGAGGYTGTGGGANAASFGFGGGGGGYYSSFGGTGAGGGVGLRGTQITPVGFGGSTVGCYTPWQGYNTYFAFGAGGGGGAGGGTNGDWGQTPWTSFGPNGQYAKGGTYGGGGGGSGTHGFSGYTGGPGAQGGCRIIWGAGREFPGTLTDDV